MVGSQIRKGRYKYFFIVFVLFVCISMSTAASSPAASTQELEVQKLLNRLNKPALHTIQSPDGDIIDCIHISQQQAFDHPLLEDHKIQMSPTYYPEGVFDENKMSTNRKSNQRKKPITQLWHMNGRCPNDTIPVRRTKKDDILRAGSVERYGKKHIIKFKPDSTDATSGHEYAIARVAGDKYYGARASINVWQPYVQLDNEFSLSQIWVTGGSYNDNLNTIESGWQIYPGLYGGNNPRLFIYWTSDSYQSTGCYNLGCSGFVQINKDIAVGGSISPVSSTDGTQIELDILIWKDRDNGNWWIKLDNSVLGYWPSSLFSHLADSASNIDWGGEVVNTEPDGHHTRTQMGSGKFPEEGIGKASYFKNLQVVDEANSYQSPKSLRTIAETSNCYNIQIGSDKDGGQYFYYGGPGQNPNCP